MKFGSKVFSLRVQHKFTIGFGFILLLLLALIGTSITMTGRINARARFVENVVIAQTLTLVDLEISVKEIVYMLEADVSGGTRSNDKNINELKEKIEGILVSSEDVFSSSAESLEGFKDIADMYGRWYPKGQKYLESTIAQDWAMTGTLMKEYEILAGSLIARIVEMRKRGCENLKENIDRIDAYGKRVKRVSLTLGIAALGASAITLLVLNRSIMKPVAAITSLMRRAERGNFTVRYQNPHLLHCWEEMRCGKSECSAHRSSNLRCWQVSGTHCHGKVQGDMASKLGECEKCRVFRAAIADEFAIVGEGFNNMLTGIHNTYMKFHNATADIMEVSRSLVNAAASVKVGNEAQSVSLSGANKSITGMDESIRDVTNAVEKHLETAEQNSSSIAEMSSAIEEVSSSSESLSGVVDRTTAAIEELFVSIRETARNIDSLSGDVTEISSAISEMGFAVEESAKSARQVNRLSEEVAKNVVQQSMEATKKAIGGIERIRSVVSEAEAIIKDLGAKSQDIGSILKVIQDISDQTNLLALNAAIIAAQAGEHGRGFSIVAKEVRGLSERTAASTREIDDLINNIQRGLGRAVESMRKGTESVEDGIIVIAEVDERIKQVEVVFNESSESSRFIVRATSEQSKATQQISQSAVSISDKARQIAVTAKQQASACDNLTNAVEEMSMMTTQVRRTIGEQSKTARQISESTHKSQEVLKRIERATKQETEESAMILRAMQQLRRVADGHLEIVASLEDLVRTIDRHATVLQEELGKVTVSEERVS